MICDECETVAHCMKNGCVPKMNKELLQMVFDAMSYGNAEDRESARLAIKFALVEQPAFVKQEPVLLFYEHEWQGKTSRAYRWLIDPFSLPTGSKLYTSPPAQRTWVGLTEQERNELEDYCEMIIGKAAFDAIEAKLKEKNNAM